MRLELTLEKIVERYIGKQMALQEPKFKKTHIKLQPARLEPIRDESWANIPKQFRVGRHRRKYKPVWYSVSIVNVNDIATPYLLAKFIREVYGDGKWVICFWDIYKKNKGFKQYYECLGIGCRFWDICKIKKLKIRNPYKYKVCKMNPKLAPNWSSRAWLEIKIKESALDTDEDFTFELFRNKLLMKRFWFWGSSQKGQRRIAGEERYF